MVARTPPKLRKVPPPLDPQLIRETLMKVDRCMSRLQELQITVAGGRKVVSGVSLSPRSNRAYLRTSLRCKQKSLRIKSCGAMKSPVGKYPATSAGDEWRRMSLPAMLVGETVSEILQATQFAREILSAASGKAGNKQLLPDDPKTPMSRRKGLRTPLENTELHSRRKREKQNKTRDSPSLQKARSRINFKVSPPKQREISERDNGRYLANRVSPRHKPWARKTVLFPNPLFTSSPSKQKFCRTRSPVIANKKRQTTSPHKFLIKSPPKVPVSPPKRHSVSQFHVKIRSPPRVSVSPPMRRSSKDVGSSANASKLHRSFSSSKLRQSFSPSRIASRLMSPLKGRKSIQKNSCDGLIALSGLKQRPVLTPVSTFSSQRIP